MSRREAPLTRRPDYDDRNHHERKIEQDPRDLRRGRSRDNRGDGMRRNENERRDYQPRRSEERKRDYRPRSRSRSNGRSYSDRGRHRSRSRSRGRSKNYDRYDPLHHVDPYYDPRFPYPYDPLYIPPHGHYPPPHGVPPPVEPQRYHHPNQIRAPLPDPVLDSSKKVFLNRHYVPSKKSDEGENEECKP